MNNTRWTLISFCLLWAVIVPRAFHAETVLREKHVARLHPLVFATPFIAHSAESLSSPIEDKTFLFLLPSSLFPFLQAPSPGPYPAFLKLVASLEATKGIIITIIPETTKPVRAVRTKLHRHQLDQNVKAILGIEYLIGG